MLKPGKADLLFAEKCIIFVVPRSKPQRFTVCSVFYGLVPGEIISDLEKIRYDLVLFRYDLVEISGGTGIANLAMVGQKQHQNRSLRKFMLNLLMHFYALRAGRRALRRGRRDVRAEGAVRRGRKSRTRARAGRARRTSQVFYCLRFIGSTTFANFAAKFAALCMGWR